jgi:hypothetical protein
MARESLWQCVKTMLLLFCARSESCHENPRIFRANALLFLPSILVALKDTIPDVVSYKPRV